MSIGNFTVLPGSLATYGTQWQAYGSGPMKQLGPYIERYGDQTDGMNGVLSLLRPIVRGVADVMADQFGGLADLHAGAGTALQLAAKAYVDADQTSAGRLIALGAGGIIDNRPADQIKVPFEAPVPNLPATHAESDPSKQLRDQLGWDAQAVDWVVNKFLHHHITYPLDQIIGNWTALTAQADAYTACGSAWTTFKGATSTDARNVGDIWGGVAASAFSTYSSVLTAAMAADTLLCDGIAKALRATATAVEKIFKLGLSLIVEVIRYAETAAIALAAAWWCGLGEADAAGEMAAAAPKWLRALRLINDMRKTVNECFTAMDALQKSIQGVLDSIAKIKKGLKDIQGGYRDIKGGAGKIEKGLSEAKSGLGEYLDGAGDAGKAAGALVTGHGTTALADAGLAVDKLNLGLDKSRGGLTTAASGAGQTVTGAGEIVRGGGEVASGAGGTVTSTVKVGKATEDAGATGYEAGKHVHDTREANQAPRTPDPVGSGSGDGSAGGSS